MRTKVGNKWIISWYMPVIPTYHGDMKNRPYTYYVENKRKDIAGNLWCIETVLRSLDSPVYKVVEYFGGIGAFSLFIQDILKPEVHEAYDIDENCVDIYSNTFPAVDVAVGDFYELAGIDTNVAVLDFETYTARTSITDDRDFDTVRKVFEASDVVVLVDTAMGWLHLNYDVYSKLLHRSIDSADSYFQALSEYYYLNEGFAITTVASHARASYMALVRSDCIPRVKHIRAPKEADTWFEIVER